MFCYQNHLLLCLNGDDYYVINEGNEGNKRKKENYYDLNGEIRSGLMWIYFGVLERNIWDF